MAFSTGARLPVFGAIDSPVPKMGKRCQTLIRLEDDVSAISTVTTIRSAAWHEFLTPEAGCPVTTRTRDRVDLNQIDHVLTRL